MPLAATVGARLYTSAVALENVATAADEIGDFFSIETNIECGMVENISDFGRAFDTVTFVELAEGRTRKLKGSYNDGLIRLTVGQDMTDLGQQALRSFADLSDQNTYPFRIVLVRGASYVSEDGDTVVGDPDGAIIWAPGDSFYFGAKVLAFRTVIDNAGAIVRARMLLEVNTPIFAYTN
ncbi:MAG: hypothetical protein AB7F35_06385 [Acetobacteraceae bacterium]